MPSTDAVLVLAARAPHGGLSRAAAQSLAAARRIGTPVAVLCDLPDPRIRAELAALGAHRVLVAHAPELDALATAARRIRPELILLAGTERATGTTTIGTTAAETAATETAARLAVRLEAGLITDVVEIDREGEHVSVLQETCGGRIRVRSTLTRAPVILTLRPGAFPVTPPPTAPAAEPPPPPEELRVAPSPAVRVPRLVRSVAAHPLERKLLTEADVVVAGGRGVGSAEGFALLAELAQALGGCLGATHTAGELGWAPGHARISLPGAQIRPRLYFAGGVSGSVRHRAAIRGARTVVAVDRDPRAPILREADLAVVGDLHALLPALLAELRRRRAAPLGRPEPEPEPELDPHPESESAEA